MKDSKVNRVFQWILGILLVGFGLLYLLTPTFQIDISSWIYGGIIAVAALIRLIFTCLPGSTSFAGTSSLEIVNGVCEALFGVLFVLNSFVYIEFIFPVLAVLLVIMAVVRLRQSALIRRQGQPGFGSYTFMAVLFLFVAAGLVATSYVIKVDLQLELTGGVVFIYGFFLISSSYFKQGQTENVVEIQPMISDIPGEKNEFSENGTEQKLTEH